MTDPSPAYDSLLKSLIETCETAGATGADARLSISEGVSVEVRGGVLENIERAESRSVSLRCLFGQKQAHVSGADLSSDGLETLAERCVAMARAVPEDPYCGLADPEDLQTEVMDFDTDGDGVWDEDQMVEDARIAEATALAVDGVQTVSNCGAGWSRTEIWLASTNGFSAGLSGSSSGLGLAVVAERDGKMERDYESRSTRYREDRPGPETIGQIAAERAVARLAPRKVATQTSAVIYDRRVASSLISTLTGSISGPAIARGVSFLKDRLGDQVFGEHINIIDDPFRKRGFGSRAFDGEGRAVRKRAIIENGVLGEWLLNGPSARQLGLKPNGYASMGFGDPPGVTTSNLYLEPGTDTPAELMERVGKGLLVTDMFGPSINPNTGDYSVGVSGFWFEGGEVAFPVSEVTIAGDLPGIYARLQPASDLELRGTRDAPSILVQDMSIAGE
ncbi:MAG: TldD/PmbA family protein [Pseudomonadota bacterium]